MNLEQSGCFLQGEGAHGVTSRSRPSLPTCRPIPKRTRPIYAEMTSRIRQQEIPHLLRRLEQRHDAARTEDDPLPLRLFSAQPLFDWIEEQEPALFGEAGPSSRIA